MEAVVEEGETASAAPAPVLANAGATRAMRLPRVYNGVTHMSTIDLDSGTGGMTYLTFADMSPIPWPRTTDQACLNCVETFTCTPFAIPSLTSMGHEGALAQTYEYISFFCSAACARRWVIDRNAPHRSILLRNLDVFEQEWVDRGLMSAADARRVAPPTSLLKRFNDGDRGLHIDEYRQGVLADGQSVCTVNRPYLREAQVVGLRARPSLSVSYVTLPSGATQPFAAMDQSAPGDLPPAILSLRRAGHSVVFMNGAGSGSSASSSSTVALNGAAGGVDDAPEEEVRMTKLVQSLAHGADRPDHPNYDETLSQKSLYSEYLWSVANGANGASSFAAASAAARSASTPASNADSARRPSVALAPSTALSTATAEAVAHTPAPSSTPAPSASAASSKKRARGK